VYTSRAGLRETPLVHHGLEASCLEELLAALPGCPDPTAGSSDLTLCEGFVELRFRRLDGRAVCAAMTVDGVLWVVVDPAKPDAQHQAREMLGEWRTAYLQPTGPC
jgi:hypothetical protein